MNRPIQYRLVIEAGENEGMVYPLDGEQVTLGRAPESTIQILDTRISRTHLILEHKDEGWFARDNGSKNGTSLNGEPFAGSVHLVPGDVVQMGDSILVFESEFSSTTNGGTTGGGVRVTEDDSGLKTSTTLKVKEAGVASDMTIVRQAGGDADERLRSLYEIGQLIQTTLELDDLIQKIVDSILNVLLPTHAAILLYDQKLGIFVPKVIHRPDESNEDIVISSSILHKAMEDRVGVLMTDPASDRRFQASESIVCNLIRSAICVPLICKGDILGAIYLDTREFGRTYDEDDLQWVVGVSTQAALGISVSLVHQESLSRSEQKRDLEIARSIQMNLLPKTMPEIAGFQFWGTSEPALMVGGDYYDIAELPDGDIALAIADVSGKGIPAAILVASVRSAVRIESRSLPDHGILEVVKRLNQNIYEETMSHMFVSMVLAYFEPEMRRLTYCNAGHVHPILCGPDGRIQELDAGTCFLGVLEDIPMEKGSVKLEPGSILVFVTDGVTEAMNREGDLYGTERLSQFVAKHARLSARDFCDALQNDIERFREGTEPTDDLTVLVLRAA